jgi:hypothetical protein
MGQFLAFSVKARGPDAHKLLINYWPEFHPILLLAKLSIPPLFKEEFSSLPAQLVCVPEN